MSNPFDGLITTELITQFDQAISEVIRANETPARIYLPITRYQSCSACVTNTGNANPFLRGKQTTSCQVCGGTNKIGIITTIDINLVTIFDYKKWQSFGTDIAFAKRGDVQTFSKISTIKDIKRADYIVFDTDIEASASRKFKRMGEPEPIGFHRKNYIITAWEVVS